MYSVKLEELESKDIMSLKKRIGELKGMEKGLKRDLQEADLTRTAIIRGRENVIVANNNPKGQRREH